MKSFSLAIILSMLCAFAFAHEDDAAPTPSNPEESEQLHSCQVQAARAAWGADARFHGAPRKIKYAPMDEVYTMMTGKSLNGKRRKIPGDGIYVAKELKKAERDEYKKAAFIGWDEADKWVKAKRKPLDRSILLAIFLDGCKKATMPQKKEEPKETPNKNFKDS